MAKRKKAKRKPASSGDGKSPEQMTVAQALRDASRHHRDGRLGEAEVLYRRILQTDPENADANHLLGVIARQTGHPQIALDLIGKALQGNPGYAEAHYNLGNTLKEIGRLDEAEQSFRRALDLKPDYLLAFYNLGALLSDRGRLDEAEQCNRRVLDLNPEFVEAHNNLGIVLTNSGRPAEAEHCFRRALELQPAHAAAHCNLGIALVYMGRPEEGEQCCRRALELKPDLAEAHNNLGSVRVQAGDREEALRCFHRAIDLRPNFAEALRQLVATRRNHERDGVIQTMERLYADPATSEQNRTYLAFGLGKACDDMKCHDEAFPYLLEGNRLKRKTYDYDTARNADLFQRIRQVFQAPLLEKHRQTGRPDSTPIFILGMPRSGTTLVEQILASHPHVAGAGELRDLDIQAPAATAKIGKPFPEGVGTMDAAALNAVADAYLGCLRTRGGDSQRITDKMPANFLFIGLIKLALPVARIVHTHRHPMDTCLSIFANFFTEMLPFAYDLKELGDYYRLYEGLMDHWRRLFPGGFLDLSYEALVAEPEREIRRLLDHCDLEFHPACLEFHKTKRIVRTASATQVRRPIYRDSLERWRAYEEFLGPLGFANHVRS
jgi:tetratricopeptide (TPR) repeat protein